MSHVIEFLKREILLIRLKKVDKLLDKVNQNELLTKQQFDYLNKYIQKNDGYKITVKYLRVRAE